MHPGHSNIQGLHGEYRRQRADLTDTWLSPDSLGLKMSYSLTLHSLCILHLKRCPLNNKKKEMESSVSVWGH